jgi:hypothetical protein
VHGCDCALRVVCFGGVIERQVGRVTDHRSVDGYGYHEAGTKLNPMDRRKKQEC